MLLAATWIVLSALGAPAHEGNHERIEAITQLIERDGGSAALYMERAELHRLSGHYDLAAWDLTSATNHGADNIDVHAGWARLRADEGVHGAALGHIERVLAVRPDDEAALLLRARSLAVVGELERSVATYDRIVAVMDPPRPEVFVERARIYGRLGPEHVDVALAGLDDGLARLGPVPSLQLEAIELELQRDAVDGALERLETLSALSPRSEHWLARKGDILADAERYAEARRAYEAAARALDELAPRQRETRAAAELADHIQRRLAALPSNSSTEPETSSTSSPRR